MRDQLDAKPGSPRLSHDYVAYCLGIRPFNVVPIAAPVELSFQQGRS
jgi:hypothetical protein